MGIRKCAFLNFNNKYIILVGQGIPSHIGIRGNEKADSGFASCQRRMKLSCVVPTSVTRTFNPLFIHSFRTVD